MSFISNDIDLIVKRLQDGEIAAIPTETVYGLAADYRNEDAIEKIFTTKGRPSNHPLILHVLKDWDLKQWAETIPDQAHHLIAQYWPGPLSLVFKKTNRVSPKISGGQDTVAIRAPHHPITEAVLKKLGHPIVAPSANPFEKISPTTAHHVLEHFPDIDLAILDGGRCQMGMESTIIDMAFNPGQLLRQGQLYFEELSAAINTKVMPKVPGQHHKHYQPKKPFFYFESIADLPSNLDEFYILCFNDFANIKPHYQFSNESHQIFYEFYYQIQLASQSNYPQILIEKPGNKLGIKAIIDRIERAAQAIKFLPGS